MLYLGIWVQLICCSVIQLSVCFMYGSWFPSESGSAQGFFCYLPGSFLATVALGLLIRGRFSVKQLCDKAPLLKALTNKIELN